MPVELHITNLDQNIDARELKRILFTVFRDHVMVSGMFGFLVKSKGLNHSPGMMQTLHTSTQCN